MSDFTHFNKQGEAVMVDVSEKKDTVREAKASGRIRMSEECYLKVKNDDMKKGDVLGVARIASAAISAITRFAFIVYLLYNSSCLFFILMIFLCLSVDFHNTS